MNRSSQHVLYQSFRWVSSVSDPSLRSIRNMISVVVKSWFVHYANFLLLPRIGDIHDQFAAMPQV